jgi:hypothetical protein
LNGERKEKDKGAQVWKLFLVVGSTKEILEKREMNFCVRNGTGV